MNITMDVIEYLPVTPPDGFGVVVTAPRKSVSFVSVTL